MSDRAPEPSTRPPATGKAHEHAARRDWPRYYDAVEGKPARDTLLRALDLFDKDGPSDAAGRAARVAVDLGCGTGRDTLELLRRGWSVVAIDCSQEAFDRLLPRVPADQRPRLTVVNTLLESVSIPPARLVNASYTLPFCNPAAFDGLWLKIVSAIPKNGRFAGQFFGERDDWAVLPDRTHHTRSQVDRLLADFVIDSLQEIENREAGATGEIKHWHIFHVVARKRA